MAHPTRALLFTLLSIPSAALADPPAPVALEVAATSVPGRLRYTLRNVSDAPVEVLADRRLLSFVATPPAPVPGVRRRAAPRLARCAHDQRPPLNEFSPRITLEPGQRYSEAVDVADLCALRTPALGPEPVEFHYGFAPPRRGAASHARSIVTDERAETFAEVTTQVPSSTITVDAPVDAAGRAGQLLVLDARGSGAAAPAGLRVSVTVRNPSVQATWTMMRPTQFSFVVTTPAGRDVECQAVTRQPSPLRDLFVRLPARSRRAVTLVPTMYCAAGTFQAAGVYRARARLESRASGEAFGFQRVFTGVVESASFPLRLSRGAIVPMEPRFE